MKVYIAGPFFNPEQVELISQWRDRMIGHLAVRGEKWVKDGDLTIQEESQRYSPNDPRYEENLKTLN